MTDIVLEAERIARRQQRRYQVRCVVCGQWCRRSVMDTLPCFYCGGALCLACNAADTHVCAEASAFWGAKRKE